MTLETVELQPISSFTSEASDGTALDMGGSSTRKRKVVQADSGRQKRSCSTSPADMMARETDSPNDSCTSSTGVQQAFRKVLDIKDVPDMDLTSSDTLEEGSEAGECFKSVRNASFSSLYSEGSSELIHLDLDEFTSELEISPSKKGYFVPKNVPKECLSAQFAALYRFTPYVVSQGTSYFQRLATIDPWLRQAAAGLPDFEMFVRDIPPCDLSECRSLPIGGIHRVHGDKIWCLVVHLTCIYLAAKVLDTISHAFLLQNILCHVHHCRVTKEQSLELEAEVLVALEWRLGPYFYPDQ